VYFHPAFPERSVRLDPLRHFGQVSDIASRLAALIPSETGSDPFKSFGWQALNNIAQGLLLVSTRPNLIRLRRFLEGGTVSLVEQVLIAYCEKVCPDWPTKAKPWLERARRSSQDKAVALTNFYYQAIQPWQANLDLEGLLSMFQHDSIHFSKMVASLLPIMNMLTSGELGPLLSPDPYDFADPRPITDIAKIARNGQVAYIGLNMLSNPVVGSAIGALLLSDLAAVAGDRYNYETSPGEINLLIDEAADAINDPCIQLLNKGRGAGLRLWLATQTISDLIARLGSEHKAYQVLGNMNTRIALRILDQKTQDYMTLSHPKTRLNYVMRAQSQTVQGETPVLASSHQTEQLKEEAVELFPAALLGMLPNFEYLATLAGGMIIKGRLPVLHVTEADIYYFAQKGTGVAR
jgi:conjugal transfer pilus assembly protein TraD